MDGESYIFEIVKAKNLNNKKTSLYCVLSIDGKQIKKTGKSNKSIEWNYLTKYNYEETVGKKVLLEIYEKTSFGPNLVGFNYIELDYSLGNICQDYKMHPKGTVLLMIYNEKRRRESIIKNKYDELKDYFEYLDDLKKKEDLKKCLSDFSLDIQKVEKEKKWEMEKMELLRKEIEEEIEKNSKDLKDNEKDSDTNLEKYSNSKDLNENESKEKIDSKNKLSKFLQKKYNSEKIIKKKTEEETQHEKNTNIFSFLEKVVNKIEFIGSAGLLGDFGEEIKESKHKVQKEGYLRKYNPFQKGWNVYYFVIFEDLREINFYKNGEVFCFIFKIKGIQTWCFIIRNILYDLINCGEKRGKNIFTFF
jgi:hypothetical protein